MRRDPCPRCTARTSGSGSAAALPPYSSSQPARLHPGANAAVAELAAEIDGSFVTRLGELIEAAAERGDDYMPLLDLLDAVDRAVSPPQPDDALEVDALLAAHWPDDTGFLLDEEEEAQIDQQPGAGAEAGGGATGGRASAYGEVTPRGARALFEAMGLPQVSWGQ